MLLYFAGSMIMYEPTEECVTDFFTDGILKRLPVSSTNPRFIMASSMLREECIDNDICRKSLARDFARLFSPEGLKLALPYESGYNGKDKDDEIHENVGEFYNSYGWKSLARDKASDDHLGVELLFLTKLIDKFLLLDDEPCCCEMKKEIGRFIGNHILSWLPEWNSRMQDHAESVYYKGIGNLIYACSEDLYAFFSDQGRLL